MLLPGHHLLRYTKSMTNNAKRTTPRARRAVCAFGPGLMFMLLLPKCPLCVAALLGSVGVGSVIAAKLAPLVHNFALVALALPLAIYAFIFVRARRRSCSCTGVTSHPTPPPRTSHSDSRPAQRQTSAS
jgi:hypothetical protein